MERVKTYNEFVNEDKTIPNKKIRVDFTECLDENIDIKLTTHGDERSHERDGKKLNISKFEIEEVIDKAESKLLKMFVKFKTFVIHDHISKLNVIGRLIKKGKEFIFKVITVMIKPNFKPRPDDYFINI
jgi:hypothetical protein